MYTKEQYRDLAVTMLKERRSPAEVWEALTTNGMERSAAEALVRELVELQRQADAASAPAANVYAPPVVPVAQTLGWDEADKGDLWKGIVAGLLCGCWAVLYALISSRTMGRETKRGIYIGTAVNFFFGLIYTMVNAIATSSRHRY